MSFFGGIVFSLMYKNSLFDNRITYRNGPDLIGWSDSTLFFSRGNRIGDLVTNVKEVFPGVKLLDLFNAPIDSLSPHIYRIPSWTDQINSEFIIGAKRFALQFLLGSFSFKSPENYKLNWITAFILLNFLLQLHLIKRILLKNNLKNASSHFFALLIVLGVNNLDPLFEGGLGQYLSLTLLIYITSHIIYYQGERQALDCVALTCGALALSYLDSLFFILAVTGIYTFFIIVIRKFKLKTIIEFVYVGIITLIICVPVVMDIPRLILSRANGHRGGWNQGRVPLLGDLAGVYNWLPSDSLGQTTFNIYVLIVNVAFVICIFFGITSKNVEYQLKAIALTFIALYLYFMWEVYGRYRSEINNYNLLKYGQYLVLFNIFLVIIFNKVRLSYQKRNRYSRNNQIIKPNFMFNLMLILVIFSSVVSSFSYLYNWKTNQSSSIQGEDFSKLKTLYSRFDFLALGFKGAENQALTLPGDLRYGNESRGFSMQTLRSKPNRELVLITPTKSCAVANCQFEYQKKKFETIKFLDLRDVSVYQIRAIGD
jgi:hypothetical protein